MSDRVPSDEYEAVRLQVTGLDPFFATPPLKQVEWPRPRPRRGRRTEPRYSAVVNMEANRRWRRDKREGVAISCGYDSTFSLSGRGLELLFAPTVHVNSLRPLPVADWKQIKRDGYTVEGSEGQQVANKLLAAERGIERGQREAYAALTGVLREIENEQAVEQANAITRRRA
jgi:hypothetical protein